jgi:hypothetical protein
MMPAVSLDNEKDIKFCDYLVENYTEEGIKFKFMDLNIKRSNIGTYYTNGCESSH